MLYTHSIASWDTIPENWQHHIKAQVDYQVLEHTQHLVSQWRKMVIHNNTGILYTKDTHKRQLIQLKYKKLIEY